MQSRIPKPLEMLAKLIACPSVSSVVPAIDQSNRQVTELLANWLDTLGFVVQLLPVNGNPEKLNLVATLGRGDGGLVLAGHTDTVPFDENSWTSDPFTLTQRDGCLYGLGTTDMKGFFPLALEAVAGLDVQRLSAPVTILATADEESSMAGARALVAAGRPLGRYAVIGEPTGLLPVYMHKGVMAESVCVRGQSGHSSNPALGNSALEGMHRVIGELLAWRTRLQAERQAPAFEVPMPTLNFGRIYGGDNPNRICAECELQIDVRLLPDMSIDWVRAELNECVEAALRDSGLHWEVKPLFEAIPPLATPRDAEIVEVAERLTGAQATTVSFGTEAPLLSELGMQTVVLGPGDIDCAHQGDEFLRGEQMAPTVQLLEQFIEHFCVRKDNAH